MDFSVRHSMPGRVRLHVPLLCRKRSLAGTFLEWLGRQAGIVTARINYDCASLVLEYDPAHEPMLRAMLERFQHASLNDIKLIASSSKPASAEANGDSTLPAVSKRFPLALPTVSLLMAFSANPLIAAVNLPLMLWNALPIARRAWKVWDNGGRLNIDVLDTLAISSSILQGVPMAGCIVTWLIKLGDWIRDLTAAGQKRAISELLEFQSKSAWVLRNGVVEAIPASALEEGDLVVVYPGEMISVDGEIVDGHATIDQKTITGEGLPGNKGGGAAGRLAADGGADRASREIRADRRHPDAESCRAVRRSPRYADAWTRRRHRRDYRRFQPLPFAGHCRLRHRHSRRGADVGVVVHDPCRAGRHHHQERRPHGEAGGHRHRRVRQDRHADARYACG